MPPEERDHEAEASKANLDLGTGHLQRVRRQQAAAQAAGNRSFGKRAGESPLEIATRPRAGNAGGGGMPKAVPFVPAGISHLHASKRHGRSAVRKVTIDRSPFQ